MAFVATNKLQKSILFNTNNNTKVFVLILCTKNLFMHSFFFGLCTKGSLIDPGR